MHSAQDTPPKGAWSTLAACSVGLALGYSVIGFQAFGLFVLPLSQAFGWGRGDISVAFTVMSYTIVVGAPLIGVVVDRYGGRRVVIPSIVAFGLAIGSLALLSGNITTFYVIYFFVALAGLGTAPPVYARVIVSWFEQRRGLALGIGLAGVGFGTTVLPLVVQAVMADHGWRGGYLALSALILCLSLPVCIALLRERVVPGSSAAGYAEIDFGHDLRSAFRTRSFWQMVVSFTLLGVFTAGATAHLSPLLQDRGLDASHAAVALSVLGLALMAGRLLVGYALDRIFAPIVVAVCLGGATLGIVLIWLSSDPAVALVAVALMGLGIGAELDFMSFLIGRYHGLRAYSRIYGILYGVFILGSGFGPLLMGYSQQLYGTYDLGLALLAAATAAGTVPLALLGPYAFPEAAPPESLEVGANPA